MNYDYTRFLLRGWIFHFFGRQRTAYAAYAEAFRINGNSAHAAKALGYIDAQRKHYHQAVGWYREAVRIAPDDAGNWYNLGYVLAEDGFRQEAAEIFRKAVALSPEMDRAWYGMGLALAHEGDHAGAAEAFQQAADRQPMHGAVWYHLGMARLYCCQPEHVEKAIRHLAEFDPRTCHRLIVDTDRSDLEHLVHDRLL
ncbi:MAG TPA: tetratricopeptide repeat protein [Rhodocyclaceae bacterium]